MNFIKQLWNKFEAIMSKVTAAAKTQTLSECTFAEKAVYGTFWLLFQTVIFFTVIALINFVTGAGFTVIFTQFLIVGLIVSTVSCMHTVFYPD